MKKDKLSLLAAGLAGAAIGYIIGKNFGDTISEKVKDVAGDAEKIKEEVSNMAEGSSEIVDELKTKAVDLITELESKLKLVNDVLKKNEE